MLDNSGFILAVDIGGSKIMTGLTDFNGKVYLKVRKELHDNVTQDLIVKLIMQSVDELRPHMSDKIPVCAGVTIPGLADPANGIWVYSSFSGIKDFKIAKILSDKLGMPVFIENDVNACACGEKLFGCCKDTEDYIWITISNGIGGGLVLNGKIYGGASGNAGEIGHMNVVENGRLCQCGNRGCLEAHSSGVSIAQRYIERIEAEGNIDAKISKYFSGSRDNINAKSIAQAARAGDVDAVEIYKETGYFLGKAIACAVNIINPKKVILGGGVAMEMDLFIESLEKTVREMVFRQANKDIKIEKTALGYDAALIGAVAVAIKGMESE